MEPASRKATVYIGVWRSGNSIYREKGMKELRLKYFLIATRNEEQHITSTHDRISVVPPQAA